MSTLTTKPVLGRLLAVNLIPPMALVVTNLRMLKNLTTTYPFLPRTRRRVASAKASFLLSKPEVVCVDLVLQEA
jgi:hypothetical protein